MDLRSKKKSIPRHPVINFEIHKYYQNIRMSLDLMEFIL